MKILASIRGILFKYTDNQDGVVIDQRIEEREAARRKLEVRRQMLSDREGAALRRRDQ